VQTEIQHLEQQNAQLRKETINNYRRQIQHLEQQNEQLRKENRELRDDLIKCFQSNAESLYYFIYN
jgi:FtsZ-binding cell division protein ZapB